LKELRLKLGIKPPQRQAEIEKRATEHKQRVEWVVRKSKRRSQIANDRTLETQYRWTPEEDQKLLKLRSSGKDWPSIAKVKGNGAALGRATGSLTLTCVGFGTGTVSDCDGMSIPGFGVAIIK
jgi:hypothetical protein